MKDSYAKAARNIARAVEAGRKAAPKGAGRAAREILDDVRADAPVRTGELRSSYEAWEDADGAHVGSDAKHAPPVEFGTSDTPAQPHVRPAVNRARLTIGRSVASEVESAQRSTRYES